jgi:hypothetical protein
MKPLVMMYVFFDADGEIKAIAPSPDLSLSSQFKYVTFPLADVEMFLESKRNPFDFYIKEIKRFNAVNYKITRKEVAFLALRTLDNYLTKVEERPEYEPFISIRNKPGTKKISVSTSVEFKNMKIGTDEEQDEVNNFLMRPEIVLYFTEQNNPYHLLYTVRCSPRTIYEDAFYVDYEMDLKGVSVYTKKVINSYGYYEDKERK